MVYQATYLYVSNARKVLTHCSVYPAVAEDLADP